MAERPAHAPSFLRAAWVLLVKDLRVELRTREILTTTAFFASLVAVMASVAFYSGDAEARVAPGAIWLTVAFSSVLALSRAWQREREESALVGLLVSPAPRAAIFAGKAMSVLVFLLAVELLLVPVVTLLFHVDLPAVAGPLALLLAMGTLGVAATGTLFGVMTARTRARDLVLASVLFPLLAPTLLSGVAGTRELLSGAPFSDLTDYFLLLGVFDAVAIAGGLALFGPLVDD
jgi:heme exporter protein B